MASMLENILVERQGVGGTVDNIKSTFSSWDSCMAKDYCKWPVIAAIIVGSLIVLSLLFCCARCLCCGVECCCGICSCFNACCPSPRRRRDKPSYNEPPYQPVGPWAPQPQGYQAQYQSHGPPTYAPPTFNPAPSHSSPSYASPTFNPARSHDGGRPQYAQFDVNKPSNPDALPSMPSWDQAENRKVEVVEDPSDHMEMKDLDHHRHTPGMADDEAPIMQGFAAGGPAAAHTRPAIDTRTGSHDPYNTHDPYRQHSPYISPPTSPYDDERQGFVAGGRQHPSEDRFSPMNNGYGGPPSGDYQGGAPAQRHNAPTYDHYENPAYESAEPQFQQQTHQFQHQSPPMPPQQSYRAFSPPAATSPVAPLYPGQRAYQDTSGQHSPVSPVSPHGMENNSHAMGPNRGYPEQYQPQQDPSRPAQGWAGGADRKPVGGSWRDV